MGNYPNAKETVTKPNRRYHGNRNRPENPQGQNLAFISVSENHEKVEVEATRQEQKTSHAASSTGHGNGDKGMKAIQTITLHYVNNGEPRNPTYRASVGVSFKRDFTTLSRGFNVDGKNLKAVWKEVLKTLVKIDNGEELKND